MGLARGLGLAWAMGHARSGAVSTYCGVSVDTRMAPGDADAGPHHSERRDPPPRSERVHETLGLLPRLRRQSVLSADIVVSRHHPGIHRHPIVEFLCRHGATLQMAHGSLNPPDRGMPGPRPGRRGSPQRRSSVDVPICVLPWTGLDQRSELPQRPLSACWDLKNEGKWGGFTDKEKKVKRPTLTHTHT